MLNFYILAPPNHLKSSGVSKDVQWKVFHQVWLDKKVYRIARLRILSYRPFHPHLSELDRIKSLEERSMSLVDFFSYPHGMYQLGNASKIKLFQKV